MATYTEVKTALDKISARTVANMQKRDNAISLLTAAQSDLAAMLTEYSGLVSAINDATMNNPTDEAWTTAKAEKDQLVSDFQALRSEIDALVTAVNS